MYMAHGVMDHGAKKVASQKINKQLNTSGKGVVGVAILGTELKTPYPEDLLHTSHSCCECSIS